MVQGGVLAPSLRDGAKSQLAQYHIFLGAFDEAGA